jgi:hypothetical protein
VDRLELAQIGQRKVNGGQEMIDARYSLCGEV